MHFEPVDSSGRTVGEEQWQDFLAKTITPRFSAGLTVLDGRGQWLAPGGNLQREPAKVVIGAVAANQYSAMQLVDEISEAFETRFGQDPVFRIWSPVCAGIHRQ